MMNKFYLVLSYIFFIISISFYSLGVYNKAFDLKTKFFVTSIINNATYFVTNTVSSYYDLLIHTSLSNKKLQEQLNKSNDKLTLNHKKYIELQLKYQQMTDIKKQLPYIQHINTKYNVIISHAQLINLNKIPSTLLVKLGKKDNIRKNMLVMSNLGLIGYIDEVYESFSNIITTTNPNFKISGTTQKSHLNIIIEGNGTITPKIKIYASSTYKNKLIKNELVNTSGLEGYFVSNLPIGRILHIDNKWNIQLLDTLDKLSYIYIVSHKNEKKH